MMTAALMAAVIFFLLLTAPPAPRAAAWTGDEQLPRRTVSGAFHVHSTASDGAGDKATIAAAAARAGLQFVILTDHGDGTRAAAPPVYLSGVLCIEGVEISTNGGHYVALELTATPYPLGGEAAAVVEDVRRFGGFGFVAHPDSPKPELAWTDWALPVDGLEWLNGDSEWRNEPRARLLRALFDYWIRPGPAMATILDRPTLILGRWDGLSVQRPVVAIAGHDAHGGVARTAEGGRRLAVDGVPSYEASFRAFSTRAILDAAPAGDAEADGRRLLHAIRRGRMFSVVDAIATPGVLDFRVMDGSAFYGMGDVLPPRPAFLSVRASFPPGAELVLFQNGTEIIRSREDSYATTTSGAAGAVRAEVQLRSAPGNPPVPWLVSNPIYFLPPADQKVGTTEPPGVTEPPIPDPAGPTADLSWHVEKDQGSSASIAPSGNQVRFDYRLRPGERASQFAALVADLNAPASFHQIAFVVRAQKPMRVSVQLRYPASGGGRWAHSVFVDARPREIVVPVDRLLPADRQAFSRPASSGAGSLLFVVDLTNAVPGDVGLLDISEVRFIR